MSPALRRFKFSLTHVCAAVAAAGSLFGALPAHAGAWSEYGDAGQTPATAQFTGANVPLDQVFGSLFGSADADVFRINIVDPANFSAATNGLLDTQLFLFTEAGAPVFMNDDASGFSVLSALPQGSPIGPIAPGIYLLAVAMAGYDPVNENGQLMFESTASTTDVRGPNPSLQPSVLGGFTSSFDIDDRGDYDIVLTGVNGVPTPSSLLLAALGIGLCGQAAIGRRRSRAAARAAA